MRHEYLQAAALLALAATLAIRVYTTRMQFVPVLSRRILVLGTGPEAQAVEQSLRTGDFRVLGFYPLRQDDVCHVPQNRIISPLESLAETTRKLRVSEIIVAVGERRGRNDAATRSSWTANLPGVRVLDLSTYFERALGQVRLDSLRASWLIFGDGFRQGAARTVIKRVFDVVVAMLLFLLALPLMVAVVAHRHREWISVLSPGEDRSGRTSCSYAEVPQYAATGR